jgi:polyferredoxin
VIILFNFGWFREQFCIIACPYGRLQSVFMDSDSLIVGYDTKRTDCVSCNRCVRVCPTGIDIRRGVQMECIMCTACIDACNTVMTRVGQPTDLISYTTGAQLSGGRTRWLRPRVGIYAGLIFVVIIALCFIVTTRDLTPIFARTSKVAPYQILPNGQIVNPFTFSIHNQYFESITISLRLAPSDPNSHLITWITPTPTLTIPGGGNATQIVMIQYPVSLLRSGKRVIKFQKTITHSHHGVIQKTEDITLVGPLL